MTQEGIILPVAGADLRAALVASCFRGALPPVDLRAVCLVRAIVELQSRQGTGRQHDLKTFMSL